MSRKTREADIFAIIPSVLLTGFSFYCTAMQLYKGSIADRGESASFGEWFLLIICSFMMFLNVYFALYDAYLRNRYAELVGGMLITSPVIIIGFSMIVYLIINIFC